MTGQCMDVKRLHIEFYEHLMNLKIKITKTIGILYKSYIINHIACKLYAYLDQKSSDLFTILILQKIAFGLTLFDIQDIFDLFTDFYLRYLIYLVHQPHSMVHRLWTICPIFHSLWTIDSTRFLIHLACVLANNFNCIFPKPDNNCHSCSNQRLEAYILCYIDYTIIYMSNII